MASPVYPSDLSDDEWALLCPLIPVAKPGGRPRELARERMGRERTPSAAIIDSQTVKTKDYERRPATGAISAILAR